MAEDEPKKGDGKDRERPPPPADWYDKKSEVPGDKKPR